MKDRFRWRTISEIEERQAEDKRRDAESSPASPVMDLDEKKVSEEFVEEIPVQEHPAGIHGLHVRDSSAHV